MSFFLQESDVFMPESRESGDQFKIAPYSVTVTHVSDYNAYIELNLQVFRDNSDEVKLKRFKNINASQNTKVSSKNKFNEYNSQ